MNEKIPIVARLVNPCTEENASKEQAQEEYTKKYNRLMKCYENEAVG
ncbi:MAG: hypothetical protein ACI4O7_06960 [Aristaeellaceae bacterium]